MAESLAVVYRPRRFAEVAGQRGVVAVLRSAAARSTPPQGILLAGPSGQGKTTTARLFAAALLCESNTDDGDACGMCRTCLEITGPGGEYPDVIELDAASNGGKDEIRALASRATLAPLRGSHKVYIIDEAHGLTGPGAQAFLRLLEEPPPHCIFILATTDPQKLPDALRGRCLHLEVTVPSPADLVENLRRIVDGEDWDVDDEVLRAVVAASDPALGTRGTVMTLDKLAGPLSEGEDISSDTLETLLGAISPARLRALTHAIASYDKPAALEIVMDLLTSPGAMGLRRQLLDWAYRELHSALRAGDGEEALRRYACLVEAGQGHTQTILAVARMAEPPGDLASLTARAERAVTALRDTLSLHGDVPAQASPPSPAAASAAQAPAEALEVRDSRVIAVLNAAGRSSSRAASALRRCTWQSESGDLVVSVPDHLADAVREWQPSLEDPEVRIVWTHARS